MSRPPTFQRFKKMGIGVILVVALLLFWRRHVEQQKIQIALLERCFSRIEARDSNIFFVPSPQAYGLQLLDSRSVAAASEPRYLTFNKPLYLDSRDSFRIGDEHFSVDYSLENDDSDGISIHYSAIGGPPSPVRWSFGTVKLKWK